MENQRAPETRMAFWKRLLWRIIIVASTVDLTFIAAVFIATLLVPFAGKETSICSSPTCIKETIRMAHLTNSFANPCEDLYEFVCGNSQRNSDPIITLKADAKRQIIDLYGEPSKLDEHPMVATMKKLFRACVNEVPVEIRASNKNIKEIKKALKLAGGWPLLEGSKWDEKNFDWLQATYKFRELGYYYEVFLNLSITEDPRDTNKHIFKVSLPKLDVVRKKFMTEIAVLFGANDNHASSEVDETYNYTLQLFYESKNLPWVNDHKNFSSVASYQQKQGLTINWLEFINKIISPVAYVGPNDVVIFPQPEHITTWVNLLSKIPKRIQANYMMWKVTEEIISDLKLDVQGVQQVSHFSDYRAQKCLDKIQGRFRMFPNPIDVQYIRKYLPNKKVKMAQELVSNVKVTFLELMKKAKWINASDKRRFINTMYDTINDVIIGAPINFFEDNVLDEMNVDMEEVVDNNYLSLLLQVRRNYQSLLYKQIHNTVGETKSLLWNLLGATEHSLHYYADNAITLPATILQGTFFNENRPNYLNYGSLGSFIASEFANKLIDIITVQDETAAWSNKTQQAFLKIRRCFLQQVMDYLMINGVKAEWDYQMLQQSLGTNISYLAYQKWEKSNGIEPKLIKSPYTNHQLFWISAASFYCQQFYPLPKIFNINKQYSFYVSGIGLNSVNFAKDFHCPLMSKMNPVKKCYVF